MTMTIKAIVHREPYFEGQGKGSMYCGMHAINNAIGCSHFTRRDLRKLATAIGGDDICDARYGYYDLCVLIVAFQSVSLDVSAFVFDNRYDQLNAVKCPGSAILAWLPCGDVGHWITIRYFNKKWIIFDSLSHGPRRVQQSTVLNMISKSTAPISYDITDDDCITTRVRASDPRLRNRRHRRKTATYEGTRVATTPIYRQQGTMFMISPSK